MKSLRQKVTTLALRHKDLDYLSKKMKEWSVREHKSKRTELVRNYKSEGSNAVWANMKAWTVTTWENVTSGLQDFLFKKHDIPFLKSLGVDQISDGVKTFLLVSKWATIASVLPTFGAGVFTLVTGGSGGVLILLSPLIESTAAVISHFAHKGIKIWEVNYQVRLTALEKKLAKLQKGLSEKLDFLSDPQIPSQPTPLLQSAGEIKNQLLAELEVKGDYGSYLRKRKSVMNRLAEEQRQIERESRREVTGKS